MIVCILYKSQWVGEHRPEQKIGYPTRGPWPEKTKKLMVLEQARQRLNIYDIEETKHYIIYLIYNNNRDYFLHNIASSGVMFSLRPLLH